jgi:hypothetical protein
MNAFVGKRCGPREQQHLAATAGQDGGDRRARNACTYDDVSIVRPHT